MMGTLSRTRTILGELIGFPTISSLSNLAMIDHIANLLDDVGARIDLFHDDTGTKANLFATLGPDRHGGIVLSGHSDVVPVKDQDWSSDPFQMIERDGKLFGRGACDMKGFIAAALASAPAFAASELKRPIHFALTYDEEVGCLGARALVPALQKRGIRPAMAIVGEPTGMKIVEGHKGCCEYTVEFFGLEGHGSEPDKGVNAVEYAIAYATRLMALREQLRHRAPIGSRFTPPWTTINIGRLSGGVAHNVIASRAALNWEMRPVQESDALFVRQSLEEFCNEVLLPRMQAVIADADIATHIIGEVCGLEPMDDNAARRLVAELTGANEADVAAFGTEAGLFQKMGVDAILCGPGHIEQAHKADEYVSVSQLDECAVMLNKLGERLRSHV